LHPYDARVIFYQVIMYPTGSTLAEDRFDQPTTRTRKGKEIYVLNSKIKDLNDPTAVPAKEFSIQLVRFVSTN